MQKENIEQPDDQLGFLLMQVSLLKQRINNAVLKKLDLTYMQFAIIAGTLELGSNGSVVTQQTLVIERRLDKAMVSTVVKTLIAKKLMEKSNHPTDNRAMCLNLTNNGKRLAKLGKEMAKEIDKTFFEGIDRDFLKHTLKAILANNN